MINYNVSYDDLADVLYINIYKSIKATKTLLDDNFIIVRKYNDEVCGLTIDGYKSRHIESNWNDSFITSYFADFNMDMLSNLTNNETR